VTSSKVYLPSYVRRLDDLTEKSWLPDGPVVGSAEPQILNGPGGSREVFGATVTCTCLVISH